MRWGRRWGSGAEGESPEPPGTTQLGQPHRQQGFSKPGIWPKNKAVSGLGQKGVLQETAN